jgi:hypothetical protein
MLKSVPIERMQVLRRLIKNATQRRRRTAAIHAVVLTNQDLFRGATRPEQFALCAALGIQRSYTTEIAKMLAMTDFLKTRAVPAAPLTLEAIRDEIASAQDGHRTAALHGLAFSYPDVIQANTLEHACRVLGIGQSYVVELAKMCALAQYMSADPHHPGAADFLINQP